MISEIKYFVSYVINNDQFCNTVITIDYDAKPDKSDAILLEKDIELLEEKLRDKHTVRWESSGGNTMANGPSYATIINIIPLPIEGKIK